MASWFQHESHDRSHRGDTSRAWQALLGNDHWPNLPGVEPRLSGEVPRYHYHAVALTARGITGGPRLGRASAISRVSVGTAYERTPAGCDARTGVITGNEI